MGDLRSLRGRARSVGFAVGCLGCHYVYCEALASVLENLSLLACELRYVCVVTSEFIDLA